jgi:hypothetical protein
MVGKVAKKNIFTEVVYGCSLTEGVGHPDDPPIIVGPL